MAGPRADTWSMADPRAGAVLTWPARQDGGSRFVLDSRYRLLGLIAETPSARVWRAHAVQDGRTVAIKERFAGSDRELSFTRRVAGLKGVVPVFEVTPADGRLWIVMALMATDLGHDVERARGDDPRGLPDPEVAGLGLKLAKALRRVHRAGVVHGDVTPSNVLLDPTGRPHLSDFGFAGPVGGRGTRRDGTVDISLPFAAPERLGGSRLRPPADVYSLGATLYHAAEGRPPFARRSPWSAVYATLHEEPDPFRIPREPALTATIRAMLTRRPRQRPTLDDVIAALRPLTG